MTGGRREFAAAAILAATLAGCGEPGGETPESARPDAPVASTAEPLIDPANVTVRQVFEQSAAAAARADLRQPRDLALDETGTLYVFDYAPPDHQQVVAFGPEGEFAYRFGERDDRHDRIGPASQFTVTPWNYVMFVDGVGNALTSFLTMGTYVSSASLGGVGMAVHSMPEFGHYYLKKWDPPRRRAYVVHMQLPLDSLAMIYEVNLPPGQSVRRDARDVSFLTTSDARSLLYVAFSDVYRIRVLDGTGSTVRVVESSRRPVAKSPRELEIERERLLERLQRQVGDVSDSLMQDAVQPDTLFPLVEELSVDPGGRLWVRTHRPEVSTGTVYDVFNERGELISWVAIPAVARRTSFAPDGRLFVIDERDVTSPRIVAYEVGFAPTPGGVVDTVPAPTDN